VPRREGQAEEEWLDGIHVIGFDPKDLLSIGSIFKRINADIYHSCEPSMATWLAMRAMPGAAHIVTSRDPKGIRDWGIEFARPSKSRVQVIKNYIYEHNFLVRKAVRNANGVFVPAFFLIDRARSIYNPKAEVKFLATPTELPEEIIKSGHPVVLYMGRLDPRKRPELTLKLAKKFPEVTFKIAGKSRLPAYEEQLKSKYKDQKNIEFLGFINQFVGDAHQKLLSAAWIHINTAAREGLPNSFIEAAGHECAILSSVNPADFAAKFGWHAADENFEQGLTALLKDDMWKQKAAQGRSFVRETYGVQHAMDAHEEAYHRIFGSLK
jgi:glycosyltransferase involved in cell wall biosynthesis